MNAIDTLRITCNQLIASHITEKQAQLDATMNETHTKALNALRQALMPGDEVTDIAARSVMTYVANTTGIGSAGEYPTPIMTQEAKDMLKSAAAAGLVGLTIGNLKSYRDFSGFYDGTEEILKEAREAYKAANSYRQANR